MIPILEVLQEAMDRYETRIGYQPDEVMLHPSQVARLLVVADLHNRVRGKGWYGGQEYRVFGMRVQPAHRLQRNEVRMGCLVHDVPGMTFHFKNWEGSLLSDWTLVLLDFLESLGAVIPAPHSRQLPVRSQERSRYRQNWPYEDGGWIAYEPTKEEPEPAGDGISGT